MRYRHYRLAALIASGSLAIASSAFGAAAGDPDVSFGTNGVVKTLLPDPPEPNGASEAQDVVQQSDGKVVIVGHVEGGTPRVAKLLVVRYDAVGNLDGTFGMGGIVLTDVVPGASSRARAVLLQPDGKIIAVGFTAASDYWDAGGDVVLVRYLTDGSLDPDFGTGGIVVTDVFGHPDQGGEALLQPDGRIIVAGFANSAAPAAAQDALVARYDADGTLDETFGTGGIFALDVDGRIDRARDVVLQADGGIVIAGTTNDPLDSHYGPKWGFLARVDDGGTLDGTFGGGGITELVVDVHTSAFEIVELPGGALLVDGSASEDAIYGRSILARFAADGTIDAAFGDGGVIDPGRFIWDLDLDANGDVIGATSGFLWGHWNAIGVWRLDADGEPDPSFGHGGRASIYPGPSAVNAGAFAAVGAPDGSTITVAGFATDGAYVSPIGEPRYVTLARFHGVGSACTGDGDCDACEHCKEGTCSNGPRTNCEHPDGGNATILYAGTPVKPRIQWKWKSTWGTPGFDPATDTVGLCMWWGTIPLYESNVPPGAGWKTSPNGTVTFRDKTRSNYGIEKIRIGKKLEVKAQGPKIQENPNGFPDALFQPADDTIQLHVQLNASSGKCFATDSPQAWLTGKWPSHVRSGRGF